MDGVDPSGGCLGANRIRDLVARQQGRARPFSRWHIRAVAEISDMIVLTGAALMSQGFVHGSPAQASAILISIVTAWIANRLLHSLGAYCFATLCRVTKSAIRVVAGWLLAIGPGMLLLRENSQNAQGVYDWAFSWVALSLILLVTTRSFIAVACDELVRLNLLGHTVCFIGSGRETESCLASLRTYAPEIVPLGYFTLGPPSSHDNTSVPWLGTVDHIIRYLRNDRADQIIVVTMTAATEEMRDLMARLKCLPVLISMAPEAIAKTNREIGVAPIDENGRLITIARAPLQGWRWILKDIQDRVLAGLLVAVCLPCFLFVAAGVKLSSRGPVLFRQEREGYCGKAFQIYKFRTMHVSHQADGKLDLTTKSDPRVFPFGAFLRRTSLDEIPQLLNVIRGDMWLIGPRPHSALATAAGVYYAKLVSGYEARHRVKPGITGWAQVNGWRGPTVTREQIERRVEHDLYYVENWSPLLDLKILLKTAANGFVHENAF